MALTTLPNSGMNFSENQHGNFILDKLRCQKDEGRFCDVVLHVQGRQFYAHRNILSACSPYFDSILRVHKVSKEQLTVTCGNHEIFQCLLNYMYTGTIIIDKKNVGEMLRLANHFLVTKLKNYCAEYLDRNLDTTNCLNVKELADKYTMTALSKHATLFVQCHLQEILQREEMLELSLQQLEQFLSEKSWSIQPDAVLRLSVRWVHRDLPSRERDLKTLLPFVMWTSLDGNFIAECIERDPLFMSSERCLFQVLHSLSQNNIHFAKYQPIYLSLKAKFPDGDLSTESDNFLGIALSTAIAGLQEDPTNPGSVQHPVSTAQVVSYFHPSLTNGPLPSTSDGLNQTITATAMITQDGILKEHQLKIEKMEVEEPIKIHDEDNEEIKVPVVLRMKVNKQHVGITKGGMQTRGVKCHLCSVVVKESGKLEQHMTQNHAKDITYKCGMCGFTCKWNRQYYVHMKTHFQGPPFRCDRCDFRCDRIHMLLVHRMKHSDERPFRCDHCGYRCRTKTNLVAHIRCHTGERPFPCHICGRAFAIRATLEQHMATHANDRPYVCELCGFSTKFLNHMAAHKRIHTGSAEPQYTYTPTTPTVGIPVVTSPTKKNNTGESSRSHHRTGGVRPHGCTICGRRFLEKSHLVRHERIHFNERPFKCEQCEYASTRRDKLKEHRQRHHHAGGGPLPGKRTTGKGYKPRPPRLDKFDPSKVSVAAAVSAAGINTITTADMTMVTDSVAAAGFQPMGLDLHLATVSAGAQFHLNLGGVREVGHMAATSTAMSRGLMAKLEELGVGVGVGTVCTSTQSLPPHSQPLVSSSRGINTTTHHLHHPPPIMIDPHLHVNPPTYNGGLDPHRGLQLTMPPTSAIQTQTTQHTTDYSGLPACMTLF